MNADDAIPTPERLAAYADGELHGPERSEVEAWLKACPQARAEVDALRRLASLCRRTTAPDPSPDSWETVLNRLHAACPSRRKYRAVRQRRPFVPAVAAAAAVLLVALLARAFWPTPPAPPAVTNPGTTLTGPLDLADARDVEIISMDGEDTDSLLIGHPPIREALLLAGPGDVTLVGVEALEGAVPNLHRTGTAPIMVPAAGADSP